MSSLEENYIFLDLGKFMGHFESKNLFYLNNIAQSVVSKAECDKYLF